MKYFDEEDMIKEYEKQLQKKDKEIERLNKDLKDACEVIERLKEDKKKAIEYINKISSVPNVFGNYAIDGNCKKWLLKILDKENNNE